MHAIPSFERTRIPALSVYSEPPKSSATAAAVAPAFESPFPLTYLPIGERSSTSPRSSEFPHAGIGQDEDVEIAAERRPVVEVFATSADELQDERGHDLLELGVSRELWRERVDENADRVVARGDRLDFVEVLFPVNIFEPAVLDFERPALRLEMVIERPRIQVVVVDRQHAVGRESFVSVEDVAREVVPHADVDM